MGQLPWLGPPAGTAPRWAANRVAVPWLVEKATNGRWITIGGQKGKDGKRHGGSPVFIENGRITKGHPSLTGKKIDSLKDEADTSHRQELRSSKGHEVASWRKKARKAGHDPKALDALAADLKSHHDAFAGERKEVLQHARQHHRANGFGELSNLAARSSTGKLDADALRGFDQTAERTAAAYPHHFHPETGEHGSHEDQLFAMLSAGDPEPMAHGEAYSQAFEHLENERHRRGGASFDFGASEGDPFKSAVILPWVVDKAHDVSGEKRDEGGQWTAGGAAAHKETYRALLSQAKEARRTAHGEALAGAKQAHESANAAHGPIQDANNSLTWESGNDHFDDYRQLDELVTEYDPDATVAQRAGTLKDIITAAKAAKAVEAEEDDENPDAVTAADIAANRPHLDAVIAHARGALAHLRTHVEARRHAASIRDGSWLEKAVAAFAAGRLAWLVEK